MNKSELEAYKLNNKPLELSEKKPKRKKKKAKSMAKKMKLMR